MVKKCAKGEWNGTELCTSNFKKVFSFSLSNNQQRLALLASASKNGEIESRFNVERVLRDRCRCCRFLSLAKTHLDPAFESVVAMKFALGARLEMNVISSFSAARGRLRDETG